MEKEDIQFFKKEFILIILLVISLTYLYIDKLSSYSRYERVSFQSSGATLYANLFYPTKPLPLQDNRPLVIYCHGLGSQRDFDLRIPVELTKRGFYVAALDYHGHGESGGTIFDIDPSNGIPALAEDCTKLLNKLETLPFYSNVNTSQIGLIGHSLGGMVVLMNQALDPRINVTVAWAPLVDPSVFNIFMAPQFIPYTPVNLLNETNTNNLLIIAHVDDEVLNFNQQALVAQNLTNCDLIPITQPLIGGGHQLFSNKVIIDSINWFENEFFGSESINGPIRITFIVNYIIIFITFLILVLIILYLISYTSRFFISKKEDNESRYLEVKNLEGKKKSSTPKKIKQITKIILATGLFLLNWEIFERLFGFIGIFFASLNITIIYLTIKLIVYITKLKAEEKKLDWVEIKNLIKSQFELKYLVYVVFCNMFFIAVYLIISFSYPFAFMWPANFIPNFIMAFVAFPVYFSMELIFRKVIYPQLSFLSSEKKKSKWTMIIAIYVFLNLMSLTWAWSFFPSVMFMYLILFYTIIQNTLIYQSTQRFSTVILSSFDIIQLFFAAVISNALGIGSALNLFVRI